MAWIRLSDLAETARSREFQAATRALEEYAYSQVLGGEWRMNDQHKALAGQGFSNTDMEMLAAGIKTLYGRVIAEPLRAFACVVVACYISWQLTLTFLVLELDPGEDDSIGSRGAPVGARAGDFADKNQIGPVHHFLERRRDHSRGIPNGDTQPRNGAGLRKASI